MNPFPLKRLAWLHLVLVLLLPLPACAWNAAGHRLVACIAWESLDEYSRAELSLLLREHPDYEHWLKKAVDKESGRGSFIEASTWADEIRQDKRFYNAGIDTPTALLPGFPDMERHSDWHYVNRQIDASPLKQKHMETRIDPASGQIDKQLTVLAKTISSPKSSLSERAYALPWLIHLTGDAHQPLHTSIRLDAEGEWDKLGKGLLVINPFNPRKNSSTLHAFWDDLPGPPWLRGASLDNACLELIALYPRQASSSSEQWIEESRHIAQKNAYPLRDDEIPTISAEFHAEAKRIADQRITLAGYRLADLLSELLRKK